MLITRPVFASIASIKGFDTYCVGSGAIIAIKFLLVFIKRHSFISFGVYRIIIALVFWFIVK